MKSFQKKFLAYALAGAMSFSSATFAFAADSVDKLDTMNKMGIIAGEGNGINKNVIVTRYRAFVLMQKLMGNWNQASTYDYKNKPNFNDLAQSSEFIQRLGAYLKNEQGVAGFPDGSFRPLEGVTARQYVKFMLNVLGYEDDVDFVWDGIGEFAEEIGLIPDASFANDSFITEAQVAEFTYDALTMVPNGGSATLGEEIGYEIVDTIAPDMTINSYDELTEDESITVSGSLSEKGTLLVNGEETELDSQNAFSVEVALEVGENTITFAAADLAGNEAYDEIYVTREQKNIEISNVESNSLKMVQVEFNSQLDASTVVVDNFAIKGKTVEKVELADDGMTVFVMLGAGQIFDQEGEYEFDYIEKVKNVKGMELERQTAIKFHVSDVNAPIVTKVETERNNEVRVTFSEPVVDIDALNTTNYDLNGEKLIGTVREYGLNSVLIYSSQLKDSNELVVKGVKDFAGHVMKTQTISFDYALDETAPEVTEVYDATIESIKIRFDEKIDFSTVSASNIKYVYTLNQTSGKYATAVEKIDDKNIKVYFKGDNNALPNNSKVFVVLNGIKDLSGNEMEKDTAIEVTAKIDDTRPEVTSVTAEHKDDATKDSNGTTEMTVKLSKKVVDGDETQNLDDNFELLDKGGKAVDNTLVLSDKTASAKDSFVISVDDLRAGDYTLVIKNLKDDTLLANKMLEYRSSFTVANKMAPYVIAVYYDANNNLFVEYSESMDNSITDSSRYMIQKDGKWVTLSSQLNGSISTRKNNTIAVIPVKDKTGYEMLEVQTVQSLAGNVLDGLKVQKAFEGEILAVDAVAPTITKAEITAKNKIKVYLNKEVVSSYYKDIVVQNMAEVAYTDRIKDAVFSTEKVDNVMVSVLTITYSSDIFNAAGKLALEGVAGEAVAVVVSAAAEYTKDVYGNVIIAPEEPIDVSDKVAPTLKSETGRTATKDAEGKITMTLEFDEEIAATDLSYGGFDLVITGNKTGDLKASNYDLTVEEGKLVITINKTDLTDTTLTVKTISAPQYLSDGAGNVINAFTAVSAAVVDAPVVEEEPPAGGGEED